MIRRFVPTLFFLISALLCSAAIQAAPLWSVLLPFKHIEADPKKTYTLQERNGPWHVMATTFTGPGAQQQADRLVLEFRKRYKLPAYIHKQKYDYTETVQGLGIDPKGRPKRMKYLNATVSYDVAVLVGDYDSYDESKAQKTLEKIKYMRPDSLRLDKNGKTSQTFGLLREEAMRLFKAKSHKDKKGFMRTAFITRNPLLPEGYFVSKGLDPLVIKMNKHADHSLLTCPGAYSVRVATFRGNSTMILKEIERFERGAAMHSKLEEAAEKAHKLTIALRRRGFEAYEFHDRHESIVTVGSFDSTGHPRDDGRIEINPGIHRVMKTFSAEKRNVNDPNSALKPRVIEGILLDIQPIPVQVPRQSIGASYTRKLFFR